MDEGIVGEEVDVLLREEAADVCQHRGKGAVDLHLTVECVVDDQVIGHADPMGLHRVALTIVVVPDA